MSVFFSGCRLEIEESNPTDIYFLCQRIMSKMEIT